VSPGEAYLIARMQVALVGEGVLHSINMKDTTAVEVEQQLEADQAVIREAVCTAWAMLAPWERHTVRRWGPDS
jgi:hypothetical protein